MPLRVKIFYLSLFAFIISAMKTGCLLKQEKFEPIPLFALHAT